MPDILDSAQKQIDEAASVLSPKAPTPSEPPIPETPTPPTSTTLSPAPAQVSQSPPGSPPAFPAEEKATADLPPETTQTKEPAIVAMTIEPPAGKEPLSGGTQLVDSLLATTPTSPKPPPLKPSRPPKSAFPPKKSHRGLLLTILLILLITVPLGAYYVSQQQQLADLRSRAAPYPTLSPTITRAPTATPTSGVCAGLGGEGQVCRVPQNCNNLPNCDGDLVCLNGICRKPTVGQCGATGRCRIHLCDKCSDYGGGLQECRSPGQEVDCASASVPSGQCGQIDILDSQGNYCGVKQQACTGACVGGPPPTQPPGATATPTEPPPGATATPTSTPPPGGQCTAIAVYDADGNNITAGITAGTRKLSPGETVILGTPKGTATKARFRVQGLTEFQEYDPAAATATEFRLRIQIPTNITQAQGSFEAEVFINGQWR